MNLAVKTLPVRRSHAERTALSDARMLDAAVSLIVTRGAAGTTLKEVGELAGYSRGLASVRFGNKAALFAFIVRSVGEEWLATLREAVREQVGHGADVVRAHFAGHANTEFVMQMPQLGTGHAVDMARPLFERGALGFALSGQVTVWPDRQACPGGGSQSAT
jgi:AcrR family transcriptional regulator